MRLLYVANQLLPAAFCAMVLFSIHREWTYRGALSPPATQCPVVAPCTGLQINASASLHHVVRDVRKTQMTAAHKRVAEPSSAAMNAVTGAGAGARAGAPAAGAPTEVETVIARTSLRWPESLKCSRPETIKGHIGVVIRAYPPQADLLRAMLWALGTNSPCVEVSFYLVPTEIAAVAVLRDIAAEFAGIRDITFIELDEAWFDAELAAAPVCSAELLAEFIRADCRRETKHTAGALSGRAKGDLYMFPARWDPKVLSKKLTNSLTS